jgi:hypothetical protein
MNSRFCAWAVLATALSPPERATAAPTVPAFFINSLRLIVFLSDIVSLLLIIVFFKGFSKRLPCFLYQWRGFVNKKIGFRSGSVP